MSILTIVWSMCAAACAMMAFLHLAMARFNLNRSANLLVFTMALGGACVAFTELVIIKAADIESCRQALRIQHLFLTALLVPIPWYIQVRFATGRRWLAILASFTWLTALVLNYTQANSLTFSTIEGLSTRHTFWGEPYTIIDGTRNPLALIADIGVLLIIFHAIDATLRQWRRERKTSDAIIGASISFFSIASIAHVPLVDLGILETPSLISLLFLAIVASFSLQMVLTVSASALLSEKVTANELRWRTLLEHIDQLVVSIDPSGRIAYVNPYMCRMSGYSRDQLLDSSLRDFTAERDIRRAEIVFREAMEGRVRDRERIHLMTRSGEERLISWNSVPLYDENKKTTGLITVGNDITARLKAEHSLRETRAKLEQSGRLNVLGELTTTLAHELNQPLAAILSNAQAARRFMQSSSPDLDEIREILDDIVRDDKRASDVIQRLRDLIQPGKTTNEQCDLNELISETLEICQAELTANQVHYELHLAPQSPTVEAGPVELQQVLLNLIANAKNAMLSSPHRQLWIESRQIDDRCEVRVRDTGPGIPSEIAETIFDPLTTSRSDGLGMGLAICRRILALHGGLIEARNNLDGGAEFVFTLPLSPSTP